MESSSRERRSQGRQAHVGMEAPAGPPRFKCPSDFSASPFCPGPPFSQGVLQSPSKQLWLIRAPASFSPESLDGQVVPLLGCQTLNASQPDGTQKIFRIQSTLEPPGGAHLLVPSGHGGHMTCSPLFGGSLSICEKYGEASGDQPLFPVVARAAPQIPEGLKQRFVPFGNHPKGLPLPGAADEPPRKKKKKKKKKHQLLQETSEKQLPSLAMSLRDASEPSEAEVDCQYKQGAASWVSGLHTEAQPCSTAFAQDDLLSGAVEDLTPRKKKKKKKKKEGEETAVVMSDFSGLEATPKGELVVAEEEPGAGSSHCKAKKKKKEKEDREVKEETGEAEGLLDSGCSEHELWLARDSELPVGEDGPPGMPEAAQHKHKGTRKEMAVGAEPISVKEETAVVMSDFSGLKQLKAPAKRKKKKKEKENPEEAAQQQWAGGAAPQEPSSLEQELDTPLVEGGGGQVAEPGAEEPRQRHKKKKAHHEWEAAQES